ncbi:helix-turn-helix domain-containing protein [Methylovulum psychrotolerans]|uniref:Winged helix-turn-helix domain-containing protein n=1 Tax=Methylovulum psychrotolerans TaxID=1704499 RepID=A0A2S5CQC6_9GAMM|nr:helix-turn-helix domain-containing protein [Methylovulum psychrotolerans]POZ52988.1 hypothetical protein AADEFJLK_01604 [Methylovulum psychrotolerans]
MGKSDTTRAANAGRGLEKSHVNYSTENHAQRERILAWLLTKSLSTAEARRELDIMHPAGRVQELREQGHNIVTHWVVDTGGKVNHRVASYVLLSKEAKP